MSAGVLNLINFAKESTWGTAVTPNKSLPVQFEGGISTDIDLQMLSAMKGQFAANYDSITGKRSHSGDYTVDFFPDYPGYFLLSAFGAVSSALKGGESVVYQHTYSESGGSNRPSLTIEQVIGENIRRYAGVLCDGFKISAKKGEVVTISPSLLAKTQAYQASPVAASFLTVRPFNFADITMKIGGSSVTEFSSFELEYKNGLKLEYGLGSNDPLMNYVGKSTVTAKLELYLDSTMLTEYNNYLSKTARSLEFIGAGPSIGVSSTYGIDILVPNMVYKTAETKINDDVNILDIQAEAVYDTSTSKLLSAVLTNLLTAYS